MARYKNPTLSDDKINEKKGVLSEKIKQLSEDAKEKKSPSFKFLDSIESEIRAGVESGVRFTQLSKVIEDVYGYKISSQSISLYSKNVLKIKKNPSEEAVNMEQ